MMIELSIDLFSLVLLISYGVETQTNLLCVESTMTIKDYSHGFCFLQLTFVMSNVCVKLKVK